MRRLRDRSFAVVLLAMVAAFAFASPARASGGDARQLAQVGESIENYDVSIVLGEDSTLTITEVIDYDFGPNQRRGIFRFVPTVAKYDDTFERYYDIEYGQIETENLEGPTPDLAGTATQYDEGDNRVLRIGDESTFISGRYRYTINYTASAAVEAVTDPDGAEWEEVVWNAVGTQWGVPIASATITFSAPGEILDTRCFRGALGSQQRCEVEDRQASTASFGVTVLEATEGATIAVSMPTGTVIDATPNLRERQTLARAFRVTPVTGGGFLFFVVAFGAGLFAFISRTARDRRLAFNAYLPAEHEPDRDSLVGFFEKPEGPVRFNPPKGATPGLVGVIVDEKADPLEVSATIVDLAVRGYLRIEELDEKGKDHALIRLQATGSDLLDYEQFLLDRLFSHASADAPNRVRLSELKQEFRQDLKAIQEKLYGETMRRHWFVRRPDRVRAFYFAIGLVVTAAGLAATVALAIATSFALLGIPFLLAGVALVAAAKFMPARTPEGRKVLEEAVGYERFLDVADAEELQFAEQQNAFIAGLPYAVVFGLTRKWASVLAVLQEKGLEMTPTWYSPYNPYQPFSFYYFGTALSGFTSNTTSSLVAPPPQSSGGGGFGGSSFSGGGFSGGGGGGGGGGSW